MAKIKVNGVMITLTSEQLEMIDEQRRSKPKWSREKPIHNVRNDEDYHIFETMVLMRSWAKFHNELDGFVPDWKDDNQYKFGVYCKKTRQKYIFGIAVSSEQRAEQMLAEFRDDLEKIKW